MQLGNTENGDREMYQNGLLVRSHMSCCLVRNLVKSCEIMLTIRAGYAQTFQEHQVRFNNIAEYSGTEIKVKNIQYIQELC